MRYFANNPPLRNLFFFIATLLLPIAASAKCMTHGIYLLNPGKYLNKNGIIVLEFFGESATLVTELNKKYPVYLNSKNGNTTLMVSEILRGDFNITQVVLRPENQLIENETYELKIDNLPAYERVPYRRDDKTGKNAPAKFVVRNLVKTSQPVLNDSIKEIGKSIAQFGCGPAEWVQFSFAWTDVSAPYVKAIVQNNKTGRSTSYIFLIQNGTVSIGHGMCSGGIRFDAGTRYVVSFSLMDESGNKSEISRTIPFTRPQVTEGAFSK